MTKPEILLKEKLLNQYWKMIEKFELSNRCNVHCNLTELTIKMSRRK